MDYINMRSRSHCPARHLVAWSAIPLLVLGASANAALLDLSAWSAVAYDGTGGTTTNPDWVLESGNTMVRQKENAKSSVFLSDFSIDHSIVAGIAGTFEVKTSDDDDQVGFVFGVQDPGAGTDLASYYLFQWKAGTSPKTGAAIRKLINSTPLDADLEGTTDTATSTILERDENLAWSDFVEYSFAVTFNSLGFNLTVSEGLSEIINWDIADTTYTGGQVGFFNSSQNEAVYSMQLVPIPAAAYLFASALGLLGWMRRKSA
jgi:hypothetical protein